MTINPDMVQDVRATVESDQSMDADTKRNVIGQLDQIAQGIPDTRVYRNIVWGIFALAALFAILLTVLVLNDKTNETVVTGFIAAISALVGGVAGALVQGK